MEKSSSNSRLVPGIGRIPFPAYRGKDPYIFVSYAHKNAVMVFAEINRWNKQGYNVWYDEGIAPGNEWADEISDALEHCSLYVVFLTPDAVDSKNVRDEIYYALSIKLPIIAIYLEKAELKGGLKLRLSSTQAIKKYTMGEEEYIYKYVSAFHQYGFAVPAILRINEETDHYEFLKEEGEDLDKIAEIIYRKWHPDHENVSFYNLPDSEKFIYINEAIRMFCVAEASGTNIYPSRYSMGIRVFPGAIDFRILENAQKLFASKMKKSGWSDGCCDYEKKTYPIAPLGYRSEIEEDRMIRQIRNIQENGFDFFTPISIEEKKALFEKVFQALNSVSTTQEVEKYRITYSNFIEITDMANDANIRLSGSCLAADN
ncbi:MAG: toll/interleukin-1 receptor domain-containing protein [Oscillospiraceae bacterium]|nr:toll/interleukin-1 receptor domain-containing protein [Oscillospiraceae bacterium]